MLQVTDIHSLGERDPFARFVWLVTQQSAQIDARPGALFRAANGRRKMGVIDGERAHKVFHITARQIAEWWRVGCWYNNAWQGYSPQLIWSLTEKDTMPNFAL